MSDLVLREEHKELFPHAKVPGAMSLAEVFSQWQEMGLEPIEVAEEDLQQSIHIIHNALTTETKWTTDNMDGLQALGIMTSALYSMFEFFFKQKPRPRLSSGKATIAIRLDGDRLTVGLDPLHDPTVVKGTIMAALCEVVERSGGGSEDFLKTWQSMFETEL